MSTQHARSHPGRHLATLAAVVAAVLLVTFAGFAARELAPTGPATGAGTPGGHAAKRWVTAWSGNPVVGSDIPFSDCPAGDGLADQTVRNVVFLSAGGSEVRVRLTNTFGTDAIHVGRATVALQEEGAVAVPGTLRTLTFGGHGEVTLAAGAQALSDPVRLAVAGLSTLLVSAYVPEQTGPVTNHPFTAQGNYLASGDRAAAGSGTGYEDTPCWMLIDGVDVRAPGRVLGTVVALGDSITDTAITTGNANRRWPDALARRLAERRGPTLSVANGGLGGNRLLAPREGEPYFAVPALARLNRDVFAQTGVRSVILFIGVNDLGFDATAAEMIAGYQQVVAQTRAQGLTIFGATITPFGGSFLDTPQREAARQEINTWVRTSGEFDAVFDFADALADPADPAALDPAYDSGDGLHPNDAGCQALADAVDLNVLLHHRPRGP